MPDGYNFMYSILYCITLPMSLCLSGKREKSEVERGAPPLPPPEKTALQKCWRFQF